MVKFEEVHFFSPFVGEQQLAVNGINNAILKAASDVEDSKLKVLTVAGDQPIDPAVLAVAQEKLTIKRTEDSIAPRLYEHDMTEHGVNFCEPKGGEDYVKSSRESGLNIFISVHNILNIPNDFPKYQFSKCLERLKSGVPLRSLLGSPDPTKTKFIQDPETGEAKAKMTEEQAAHARHIRQQDENQHDIEKKRREDLGLPPWDYTIPLDDNSNTPCDYTIPLWQRDERDLESAIRTLGLTREELRLKSTRDLNILVKLKGLRRELIKKVKEERRRLLNNLFVREGENRMNEERIEQAVRAQGGTRGEAGNAADYTIERIRSEVSALREMYQGGQIAELFSLSREDD